MFNQQIMILDLTSIGVFPTLRSAPSPFIQISEIGLQSQSNQQIPILTITGENTTDPTLTKLIDEQSKLQIPPDYMSKDVF